MPQGDKSAYSNRQIRKAHHIEDSYMQRYGTSRKRAERIAWATVNKQEGGAAGKGHSSRLGTGTSGEKRIERGEDTSGSEEEVDEPETIRKKQQARAAHKGEDGDGRGAAAGAGAGGGAGARKRGRSRTKKEAGGGHPIKRGKRSKRGAQRTAASSKDRARSGSRKRKA